LVLVKRKNARLQKNRNAVADAVPGRGSPGPGDAAADLTQSPPVSEMPQRPTMTPRRRRRFDKPRRQGETERNVLNRLMNRLANRLTPDARMTGCGP
jgi:hypothetical protein